MPVTLLPVLEEFEIGGYSLFNNDVRWSFMPGMNLLLGVNGIGKTTTIRALAFAIVGVLALNKNRKYFLSRVGSAVSTISPFVRVRFRVGDAKFDVTRRLDTTEFVGFSLEHNGRRITRNGAATEDEYESALLQLTGIGTLFDFDFLLKHLLIREEEAENTLWNEEDHSRVLRLLFNSGDFERRYSKLEASLQARHARYSQFAITLARTQQELKTLQSRLVDTDASEKLESLRHELAGIEKDSRSKHEQLSAVMPALEKAKQGLNKALDSRASVEEALETLEENLLQKELAFHRGLYSHYTPVKIALRKLEQYGVCMFCNRPVPEHLAKSVIGDLNLECSCLFCTQPSDEAGSDEPGSISGPSQAWLDNRRDLRARLIELEGGVTAQRALVESLTKEELRLRSDLTELGAERIRTEHAIKELEQSTPDRDEEARLASQITVLGRQTAEARHQRDLAGDEIAPLREEARRTVTELAERFRTVFSDYVFRCLGEEGSVEVQVQRSGDQSEAAVYRPVLDGRPRRTASEVSKSQAILLDYAFRMTVLRLYHEQRGLSTFFILETSEGVLDAAYVQRIGELLGNYAFDSGHLLVLVNNLSRPDFLNSVFARVPDKADRMACTLNFLKFGRLSKVQREGVPVYNDVAKQIFGDAFSAL